VSHRRFPRNHILLFVVDLVIDCDYSLFSVVHDAGVSGLYRAIKCCVEHQQILLENSRISYDIQSHYGGEWVSHCGYGGAGTFFVDFVVDLNS
jgi:hypothetical protein